MGLHDDWKARHGDESRFFLNGRELTSVDHNSAGTWVREKDAEFGHWFNPSKEKVTSDNGYGCWNKEHRYAWNSEHDD